jgi:hypothetical protein
VERSEFGREYDESMEVVTRAQRKSQYWRKLSWVAYALRMLALMVWITLRQVK